MKQSSTEKIESIEDRKVSLRYDPELMISTGRSRFETSWKNRKTHWSVLLARLKNSQETGETHAEYMKLPKEQQDRIKDIGGFVGGTLKEGRRKNGSVASRQLLTLDADFAPADLWTELLEKSMDEPLLAHAAAVYSTHKHCVAKPRLRLLMPLDRPVSPDEYEAIARKISELVGIEYFDDSTYQPARLMYWPSHSCDVQPVFELMDAPPLPADEVLALYPDWSDVSYWPMSSRELEIRKKLADKQGDPLAKRGIVGAFCRTYSITEAIEKFLPDVYLPTAQPDRYTYAAGSTAAGLVVYDGNVFAYSNHGTDPAGGQLCNAFDLVRIHKFGHLDEGAEDKTGTSRPSYKEMAEFAKADPETSVTLAQETMGAAREDFQKPEDEDERDQVKWMMQFHKQGASGVPIDIVDSAIVDYVKKSSHIALISGEPYIYDGGVYVNDHDGVRLKGLIKGCIFKVITNSPRIERTYKLLLTEEDLHHAADDINRHPAAWVNCQNGMLDLKTLRMHEHRPEYFSLNQVPFAYDPKFTVPEDSITVNYLRTAIPDDDDRRMFLEYAGYCLCPYAGFQKYLIISGEGGIGKSVLLDMVGRIVGRRNMSAITLQNLAKRFYSFFLYGKLLNCCGDLSSESMLDTGMLKMIVGEDEIPAEIKNGPVIHFKPYAKLLFSANRIPMTKDEQSNAFYRRLMILHMDPPETQYRDLKERLGDDAETFFHLAARAAHDAFVRGCLTESENSRNEVRELYMRTDSVMSFLNWCTVKDASARTKTSEAYIMYEQHCSDYERPTLSRIAFRANLREKGYSVVTIRGSEYMRGFSLKTGGVKGG